LESFYLITDKYLVITGALGWGLVALAGVGHTGKVMAWVGTAMYAAFAAGAPVGTALYERHGYAAIALATTLVPLATLLPVLLLRPMPPTAQAHPSVVQVLGAVWAPGLGLALSSLGLSAITAFVLLLFAERGWNPGWPAFTAFAAAFIAARVLLGHLVDRLGSARIALVSICIAATGASAHRHGGRARHRPSWAQRLRAWLTRWSIRASAWRPCAARRHRSGPSRWAPTPPAWTLRWACPRRPWGWLPGGPGCPRCFS
jgi:hypothetical protein